MIHDPPVHAEKVLEVLDYASTMKYDTTYLEDTAIAAGLYRETMLTSAKTHWMR
jgi:hypothetical protein